jgi:trimethylamine--corrinoid protein Co-methyltransferase
MTGINLLYEAAGMHASLLGFCLESLLIDNDMLARSTGMCAASKSMTKPCPSR